MEELEQKKAQGDKYRRMAKLMAEKQVEVTNEAADLQNDLDIFGEKTKELQKQVSICFSLPYLNSTITIFFSILPTFRLKQKYQRNTKTDRLISWEA